LILPWYEKMVTDFAYNRDTDRPVAVSFLGDMVWVTLADGRVIGNPLAWHPWLVQATPEQRTNFELRAFSVDWPDLDEGLDIEGMMRGIRPRIQPAEVETAQI
jgi:hypothetical protein